MRAWLDRLNGEVGRIEIVLAGDSDQREQGIAPGIGQGSSAQAVIDTLRGQYLYFLLAALVPAAAPYMPATVSNPPTTPMLWA